MAHTISRFNIIFRLPPRISTVDTFDDYFVGEVCACVPQIPSNPATAAACFAADKPPDPREPARNTARCAAGTPRNEPNSLRRIPLPDSAVADPSLPLLARSLRSDSTPAAASAGAFNPNTNTVTATTRETARTTDLLHSCSGPRRHMQAEPAPP